jgi:hypothetical protein
MDDPDAQPTSMLLSSETLGGNGSTHPSGVSRFSKQKSTTRESHWKQPAQFQRQKGGLKSLFVFGQSSLGLGLCLRSCDTHGGNTEAPAVHQHEQMRADLCGL